MMSEGQQNTGVRVYLSMRVYSALYGIEEILHTPILYGFGHICGIMDEMRMKVANCV